MLLITAIALLAAILLSWLEGVREFNFWEINRDSGFRNKQSDQYVKYTNAFIAICLHVSALFAVKEFMPVDTNTDYGMLWLLPVTLAIRLILLDGVLNTKRGIWFWAVGTRDFFSVLKGWEVIGKLLILIACVALSLCIQLFILKTPVL